MFEKQFHISEKLKYSKKKKKKSMLFLHNAQQISTLQF